MKIVWSETAIETFFRVVDYLFESWSITEVEDFELKVDRLLEKISLFVEICPKSKRFGFRKCKIDKQNALVYFVSDNILYLVTFIDNRSETTY